MGLEGTVAHQTTVVWRGVAQVMSPIMDPLISFNLPAIYSIPYLRFPTNPCGPLSPFSNQSVFGPLSPFSNLIVFVFYVRASIFSKGGAICSTLVIMQYFTQIKWVYTGVVTNAGAMGKGEWLISENILCAGVGHDESEAEYFQN
jgi:hypothetical protein